MKKTEQKRSPASEAKPASASAELAPPADELLGLDEIREIIELIAEKQFDEFELERGKFRIRILRGGARLPSAAPAVAPNPIATSNPEVAHTPVPASAPAPSPPEEPLHLITSPIVGTFYRAPSPTVGPFVQIGDRVEPEKTLCIIEAMKLMNEIQSDVSGIVAKIFVENGQPVEYGQKLFGIKV